MTKLAVKLEPGYYWAKLLTPVGMPEGEDWSSFEWEIVQVNDNWGEPGGPEEFSVSVPGIPVTQWPKDFEWGERVPDRKASRRSANPAQVTDAMVEAGHNGLEEWRRLYVSKDEVRAILTAAIGAGGQAVRAEATELLRNAEYGDGVATVLTQDCEALEVALSQPHPADERVVEALPLDEIRRRVRNIWGAISSNQVIDKDVEGQAKRLLADIDASLSAKEGQ